MQLGVASQAALNVAGAGVTPPEFAGAAQPIPIAAFACVVSPAGGSVPWHTEQAYALTLFRLPEGRTCASCAPTRTFDTALAPVVFTPVPPCPGAAVGLVFATAAPATPASTPWHAVQPLFGLSTPPVIVWLMCVAFAVDVTPDVAYPAPWQFAHVVFCG